MEKYIKNSPIPKIIKKVLPAVVSITASKDLPVFEAPFGPPPKQNMPNSPLGFNQFLIPKGKKKDKGRRRFWIYR
ncbi:MAG: hypothetical protein ABH800_00745 [Candidatus Nealsonbacteria bacterium]